MNLIFIAKSDIGINMKSLIIMSCLLTACLCDTENNDLKKHNKVIKQKIRKNSHRFRVIAE